MAVGGALSAVDLSRAGMSPRSHLFWAVGLAALAGLAALDSEPGDSRTGHLKENPSIAF